MKTIFNNTHLVRGYGGRLFQPQERYSISDDELPAYQRDLGLIQALFTGEAFIFRGLADSVGDGADQVAFLLQKPVAEVTTQFEKNDKTLKLASKSAPVGADFTSTLMIQIPGEPGSEDGRFVAGGTCWFSDPKPFDRVEVRITDGDGNVLRSYTDDDAAESDRGWFIPITPGHISVEPIGGYGFIPAGLFLQIIGRRAVEESGTPTGSFFCNIFWGKLE
jgi:hypothetical protein